MWEEEVMKKNGGVGNRNAKVRNFANTTRPWGGKWKKKMKI